MAKTGGVLGRQLGTTQETIAELIGSGQLKPFVAPPCARCGARLCDAKGNPRWEIIGKLTFVCLGGCPRPGPAPQGSAVVSHSSGGLTHA